MKKIYKGLYDYYEISSYCKSEGVNTEFFITEISKNNRRKSIKKIMVDVPTQGLVSRLLTTNEKNCDEIG